MEKAFVSVILPTYNRAAYLSRAIESVLAQDYENLELIVVDDGSQDNTREIVAQIKDERVIFMRTPMNRGVAAARNAGIRRAKGEYIAFQDSDDIWLPGKLAKQVEVLEHSSPDVALVYHIMSRTYQTGVRRIVPDERIGKELRQGKIFEKLLLRNYIGLPTICVRSFVLKAPEGIGIFDIQLPNLEDYELLLRIAKNYEIAYIDEVLLDTFALPDSTNSISNGIISDCMITGKYQEEMGKLGLYERKLEMIRDLGIRINASEWVEKIIQKFCIFSKK